LGGLFLFPDVTIQVTRRQHLDISIQKQAIDRGISAHLLGMADPPVPHLWVGQVVGFASIANQFGFPIATNEEGSGQFLDFGVGLVGAIVHEHIAVV
jgi:hypothetical protein